MRKAVSSLLVFFSLFAHAQKGAKPTPTPNIIELSPSTTSKIVSKKVETPAVPPTLGGHIQILSDTMGVDFRPYMKDLRDKVQKMWIQLVPQSAVSPEFKPGKVVLNFSILPDGRVAGLKIAESSGDISLDRAAYGAITYSIPLPKLPEEFKGAYLLLSTSFLYNPDRAPSKPDEKPAAQSPTPKSTPEKR